MKKATLPINYIVAIILGIIIVAVLVYWFFISRGKGGEVVNEAECNARKVAYCTNPVVWKWDEKARAVCGGQDAPTDEECKKIVPS